MDKKKKTIIKVIIGIALVLIGGIGLINSEPVNNTIIEFGGASTAEGIVSFNYAAAPVIIRVADVLDAAIAARQSDPAQLAALVNGAVSEYCSVDTTAVVSAVVSQINNLREPGDTEEKYLNKLSHLTAGLRKGASAQPEE